jgi:hypothetical protein
MSQASVILPGSPLSGSAMVGDINASFAAAISHFSGASAPTLGPGGSGALVAGQMWLNTSATPSILNIYDGANWCPIGIIDQNHIFTAKAGPYSWRNILGDNGGLEVWQRGAGSSASIAVGASSTAYTADRWYLTTGANEASVVSAVAALTNGSNLAGKVLRNNGQTGTTIMTFGYPLDTDEVLRMRGGFITISGAAKSGVNWSPASGTITMTLYTGTGAVGKRGGGFAGEVNVASTSLNLGVNVGAIFPTVSSASPVAGNATQAELQLTWTPTGTAGADDSITLDDIQIEVAQFGSAFERVPLERMLIACRRHFWKTFLYGTTPVQNAGANTGELQETAGIAGTTALGSIIFTRHPVAMRATPAITIFNPSAANAQMRNETQAADCSATATQNVTTESLTITATGSAGQTVGQIVGAHATVDAGI